MKRLLLLIGHIYVIIGCLEDEDYPETAVEIALFKETLMDKRFTEVPVGGDIVDYNYSRYI